MKLLGQTIREARIAQKITPEMLYERTRITIQNIQIIESGEAAHLPEPYFRAFVRTLAKEVGLDPDKLLNEYDARKQNERDGQELFHESRNLGPLVIDFWKKQRNTVVAIFAGIALVVLAGLYIKYGRRLFSEPKVSQGLLSPSSTDTTQILSSDSTASYSFVLQAVGLKNAWIEVRVDSGEYEETFLTEGEKVEWHAKDSVYVGLEHSTDVRLLLGGKLLEGVRENPANGVDLWIASGGIIKQSTKTKAPDAGKERDSSFFPILVGPVDENMLLSKVPIFATNRNLYQPNSVLLNRIEAFNPNFSIVCFFGTWDPLSQKTVPQWLRILQMSYLPGVYFTLIGVDQNLNDKAGLMRLHRIQGVPTVLFLSQGEELGRIVGQPDDRIENRFLEIAERANWLLRENEKTKNDTLHQDGRNR